MFPKEDYRKALADHITVSVEDLNATELALIDKAYDIFKDRLSDIKANEDEVKRLRLELANLRAMNSSDDARYEYKQTGICPTCGRDETYRNDF